MGATSTLMVPATRDSELARRLRLILTSTSGPKGTTTKVVEVPGPAIFTGLAVNNPFLPEGCRRTDCPQIASNLPCKGKCGKERVLYRAVCSKCNHLDDKGKEILTQYIGETSRTLYIRRNQHLNDFRACSKIKERRENDEKSSFILDHFREAHKDDPDVVPERDIKFSVLASFKDPLTRQIAEAVKIRRALEKNTYIDPGGEVVQTFSLNRKFEHFAPIVRRQEI